MPSATIASVASTPRIAPVKPDILRRGVDGDWLDVICGEDDIPFVV
jgi:hypothetical protein